MLQEITKAALKFLARREHSELELRQKLNLKFPDSTQIIDQALQRCTNENWLSNKRFCECFVRYRASGQYGIKRIRFDLRQKGISEQLLQQALISEDIDWQEIAKKVKLKRYGEHPITDIKLQQKARRYLAQRGFSADEIKYALKN